MRSIDYAKSAFASRIVTALALLANVPSSAVAQTHEWAGYVSVEPRVFFDRPAFPEQDGKNIVFSAVAAPEYRYEWHDGDDRVTIAPFLRWDASDNERSHFDLREANWLHRADPWTLRVGLGKVFWGVTESRHLVDVVNQTDFVEDIDEEDKLGQPLVQVDRDTRAGTVGLFVLPGFRERTFPGDDARLRGAVPISHVRSVYESGAGKGHTDLAVRWEDSPGGWDLGVSAFHGTGREPRLLPGTENGQTVLVPYYDIITQLGIDLQYTREAWAWKLEAIRRSGQGAAFSAAVAGFEYTRYATRGRGADLGLLAEYLYDGRDDRAPPTLLRDGIFVGARLSFNDFGDTTFLFGLIADRDSRGKVTVVEGQHRLGERWRLETELRWLKNVKDAAFRGWRQESFLTVRLARFF